MEDSGIEDGGDQNGDNLRNSNTSSNRSSINNSPTVPKISDLDQLIQILGEQNQRQPQANNNNLEDSSAKISLIPIERLPIPGMKEKQPLVQWDSDESEEDIINFFPVSRKEPKTHQELSDNFSIEEMSISGEDEEEEEEDEEDLHLIPPQTEFASFSCCHSLPCSII